MTNNTAWDRTASVSKPNCTAAAAAGYNTALAESADVDFFIEADFNASG